MRKVQLYVKQLGELRSGSKTVMTDDGKEETREWQAREAWLEEFDPGKQRPESVAVRLRGKDTALEVGQIVELTLCTYAREYNGRFYTDVHYKDLRVVCD